MTVFTQFDETLLSLWSAALAESAQDYPFYAPSWHRQWFTCFSQSNHSPMFLGDDGVLIPLMRSGDTVRFSGGTDIADYLDAIGPHTRIERAWQSAIPVLSRHGIRHLDLRNVPADSPTIAYFRRFSGARVEVEDTTPVLTLAGSFDEYVTALPRKFRHELRRKIRRFEEAFPDTVFSRMEQPDIDVLLVLMRMNPEKSTFLDARMERFFTALPEVAAQQSLQFSLTHGGTTIATVFGFRCTSGILLYNSGYDPSYQGAGFYMKTRIVQWGTLNGVSSVNFLQGNERYKFELGAVDRFVCTIAADI